MSELREAAQAVVEQWDTPNWKLVVHTGVLIDRLRAALAQPESEPFGWVRASDAAAFGDSGTTETATLFSVEPGSVECVPLYAHPPSEEWRPASEPPEDDRDVVVWIRQSQNHGFMEIDSFLRPEKRWRSRGVTLWRDVTPPTESPIATKCQRIEGSGEICGLTPPCPDCGSSLIDVADGSL